MFVYVKIIENIYNVILWSFSINTVLFLFFILFVDLDTGFFKDYIKYVYNDMYIPYSWTFRFLNSLVNFDYYKLSCGWELQFPKVVSVFFTFPTNNFPELKFLSEMLLNILKNSDEYATVFSENIISLFPWIMDAH